MRYRVEFSGRRPTTKWRLAGSALAFATLAAITFPAQSARAQTFTSLYSFPGGTAGAYAGFGLVLSPSGNLIGGTSQGGDQSCNPPYGCGIVFVVSPKGKETVLHRFAGAAAGDGSGPDGFALDTKTHVLYGIANGGGTESSACVNGCGVVFSIDSKGKETILYSFTGSPDANLPLGNPILDPAGNLYGVSFYGGGSSGDSGPGTVFEVNRSKAESLLYKFTSSPNGTNPNGALVRDSAGNFYGTTTYGGSGSCNNGFLLGCGIVFKVDSAGNETVVYSFTGGTDGQYPSSLIEDAAGNLYGVAAYNGYGAVFKIDTAGNFSVLYNQSFAAQISSIILGPSGSFYGTANGGNSACNGGCGLVFQLSPDASGNWTETTLHSFDSTDGAFPGGLILRNGVLYGATYQGGTSNYGTVFKLIP